MRGRLGRLELCVGNSSMSIINVHVDPNLRRPEFRQVVIAVRDQFIIIDHIGVMGGGLNFVDENEGKLDVQSGVVEHNRCWREKYFMKF